MGLSCCHLAPLLGAGLAPRLVPWAGQGDWQRVYGEGVSEPGGDGAGQSSPPWPCSPRFGAGGRRCGCGSGGCVVMGTVPAIPAGNCSLASPPLRRIGKSSKKKGEICGVGAVLDL